FAAPGRAGRRGCARPAPARLLRLHRAPSRWRRSTTFVNLSVLLAPLRAPRPESQGASKERSAAIPSNEGGRIMKVGVLGSGDVAKVLAGGFLKHGHNVMIGSRTPSKLAEWTTAHPKAA